MYISWKYKVPVRNHCEMLFIGNKDDYELRIGAEFGAPLEEPLHSLYFSIKSLDEFTIV